MEGFVANDVRGGQEEGSLLAEALEFMKQQRQQWKQAGYSNNVPSTNIPSDRDNDPHNSNFHVSETLIISMYLLESPNYTDEYGNHATNVSDEQRLKRMTTISNLCTATNQILSECQQKISYPWHMGGEGIAFGVEVEAQNKNKSILHLKAVCRYGPAVLDEWYAISLCYHLSTELYHRHQYKVAIEALDLEDGQILLIESAMYLPHWVDKLGPVHCRNRVWIMNGFLHLIPPPIDMNDINALVDRKYRKITLDHALQILRQMSCCTSNSSTTLANDAMQQALLTRIQSFRQLLSTTPKHPSSLSADKIPVLMSHDNFRKYFHRAAVVLPLHLAILIQQRPDLVTAGVTAFCSHAPDFLDFHQNKTKKDDSHPKKQNFNSNDSTNNDCLTVSKHFPFQNLVLLVVPFTKVSYSLLMSGAGKIPQFNPPKQFQSIEMKRMSRTCKTDTSSHFRNAVDTGIRLTCGLEWLYAQSKSKTTQEDKHIPANMGDVEKHLRLHWKRIDELSGGDGRWIEENWLNGPQAKKNGISILDPFINCPVFDPQIKYNTSLCPLSHANVSIHEQINVAIKQGRKISSINSVGSYPIPCKTDVDSNDWMNVSSDTLDQLMKDALQQTQSNISHEEQNSQKEAKMNFPHDMESKQTQALDSILSGFKTFVKTSSDLDGVVAEKNQIPKTTTYKEDKNWRDYFSDDEDDNYDSDDNSSHDSDDEDYARTNPYGDSMYKMKDFMVSMFLFVCSYVNIF